MHCGSERANFLGLPVKSKSNSFQQQQALGGLKGMDVFGSVFLKSTTIDDEPKHSSGHAFESSKLE